eukprot:m.175569 g.175569  ORF g.175569 m.175569 type:complete len:90 (-) comp15429_c3_seq1:87-356(-)
MATLGKALREVRLILCQSSKSSAGMRDFISSQYAGLAAANSNVSILVRECSGVEPRITGRFAFGKEVSVPVSDMSATQIQDTLKNLAAK